MIFRAIDITVIFLKQNNKSQQHQNDVKVSRK